MAAMTGPGAGSTALVTGATSGIGQDVARQLLEAGLTVHVAGRDPERLRSTLEGFAAFGDAARPLLLDVTDPAMVERAAAEVGRASCRERVYGTV